MIQFEKWLATSPFASALKIAVAGSLAALVGYALTSDWDPIIVVLGAAFLTPIINYLNPQDARYGLHEDE
jgi:hypothetical protein